MIGNSSVLIHCRKSTQVELSLRAVARCKVVIKVNLERTSRLGSLAAFNMGRSLCLLFVALFVGVVTVRGDDPWFHDPFMTDSPPPPEATPPPLYPTPETPSPYYDAPPYMAPPYDGTPPSYPPSYSPPDSSPPSGGPEPSPWFSSSIWSEKIDSWPARLSADKTVGDTFGPDAEKVYGQVSMLDGILSKGDDGYSDLLKEGITSLLNSGDAHFKFNEDDIKKSFSFKTALGSEAAATKQAKVFKAANEAFSSP